MRASTRGLLRYRYSTPRNLTKRAHGWRWREYASERRNHKYGGSLDYPPSEAKANLKPEVQESSLVVFCSAAWDETCQLPETNPRLTEIVAVAPLISGRGEPSVVAGGGRRESVYHSIIGLAISSKEPHVHLLGRQRSP